MSKVGESREKKPKTGGRVAGTPNKNTALLKDAIIQAAQNVGLDGKGKKGLEGYLTALAISEPKAFSALLGRVLPLQITGDANNPLAHKVTVEIVGSPVSNS